MKLYVNRQVRMIAPYLSNGNTILDFGCGDLSLTRGLKTRFPKKSFTGVDVVDTGNRVDGTSFRVYDGRKLPFGNTSFDITIAYHVLHHCDNPRSNLEDIMRVTKKRIILVEPIVRWSFEVPFMRLVDRLGNGWRNVTIPMPFTFQTRDTWRKWISQSGWRVEREEFAGVLPHWLPIGETVLFLLIH